MSAIHELTLAEFLAFEATGEARPGTEAEHDMGALRLAYADHWRPDTLLPLPGHDGRYAVASDWFATAFLLIRSNRKARPPIKARDAWEIAGIFSQNLLLLGRPHRGALLSTELQIAGFDIRGGRVGRIPPYTLIGMAARKSAYRIAIRRAIAAGKEIPPTVLSDYRSLVEEKKMRDEADMARYRQMDSR
jgi:hypothetical protein